MKYLLVLLGSVLIGFSMKLLFPSSILIPFLIGVALLVFILQPLIYRKQNIYTFLKVNRKLKINRNVQINYEPHVWALPLIVAIDRDELFIGILCFQLNIDFYNYNKALKDNQL